MTTTYDVLLARILGVIADNYGGLHALYRVLDEVADALDLDDLYVVLDEPPFKHQLFRAGRHPGDDDGQLALQPAGCYATPPFDPALDAAIMDACRIALRLPGPTASIPGPNALEGRFADTLAHADRSGCVFTFALVAFDRAGGVDDFARRLAQTLRRDDGVYRLGPATLALLLPVAGAEDVGPTLERASAGDRGCPGFTYSVVACPAEATDFEATLALARARLATVSQSLADNAATA